MVWLAALCGGLAFVAAGGTVALMRQGVPFILAAPALAALAAVVVHATARRWQPAPPASIGVDPDAAALRDRVGQLEATASTLRHDLRGVLSPALMMADRLVSHPDPAVRRAGDAVVRSVDRATALLTASKARPDQAPTGAPTGAPSGPSTSA